MIKGIGEDLRPERFGTSSEEQAFEGTVFEVKPETIASTDYLLLISDLNVWM